MTKFIQLENITVAELVIKYLELEGITHVFGIPGGYLSPFLDILRRHPRIKLIIARHEEGAAFMADGYARQSGKLGVIFTTAGPGATNALTGIACAKVDRSALLLIVGQPSTAISGMGAWQDSSYSGINICEIYRNVCGLSELALDPENVPSLFARALRVAYSSPRQTIHISFPLNISTANLKKVDFPLERNYIFSKNFIGFSGFNTSLISIYTLITTAKNPIFLIGGGAASALKKYELLEALTKFVVHHNIPIMTTPKAKGLFPETHPLSLGVLGLGGTLHSHRYLENYPPDIMLVLGSSLNEWASSRWDQTLRPTRAMIQVDNDISKIGRTYPVHQGLEADIESFLLRLVEMDNHQSGDSPRKNLGQTLKKFKKDHVRFIDAEKMTSKSLPLKPQRLFSELSDFTIGKKIVFFLDIGNSTGFFSHYVQLGLPSLLYSAYGFTCMGWSAGASIGAKIAAPELTCIAVLGDGAFLMNGVEIQTAARYKIGVIYMVMYDNCYGMVNHGEKLASQSPPPDDDYYSLGSPDLIKYSEALGAEAHSVLKPGDLTKILPIACQHAYQDQRPQVIVATVDPKEQAPFSKRYKAIRQAKQLKPQTIEVDII